MTTSSRDVKLSLDTLHDEHDAKRIVTDVFAFLPDWFFIRIQWSCVHFYGRRILTRAAAVQLYTTRPFPRPTRD